MTITLPPLRDMIADAKRDLDEVGLTRFVGAADETLLDAVRQRLDEQAAGEDAHGCAFRDGGDVVANVSDAPNQRVWNLINKGEVFRRLVMNEASLALAKHLLGEDIVHTPVAQSVVWFDVLPDVDQPDRMGRRGARSDRGVTPRTASQRRAGRAPDLAGSPAPCPNVQAARSSRRM